MDLATDAAGLVILRPVRSQKEDHGRKRPDDFFKSLPQDSFTPEEERLRFAILDFLAGWTAKDLATMEHLQTNPHVLEAQRYVLNGTGVRLKDWIERRIGGELTLQPGRGGSLVINLAPAGRPAVAERVELLRRGFPMPAVPLPHPPPPHPAPMPMMPPGMRPMPPAWPAQKPAKPAERERPKARKDEGVQGAQGAQGGKKNFFESLPADELLPKELELRQLLFDHLDCFIQNGGTGDGPMLSSIAGGKVCQKLKSELLKREVSLRDWIDRRIGGEIATKVASNGQVIIHYRNENDQGDAQEPEIEEPMEGTEISRDAQAFFDDLPPDGFLPEEEALREAILNFLDSSGPDAPPTLKEAQQVSEVRDARDACLSGSSGVTLKMWIDRRIGGEIAAWRKNGRGDVLIGLREVWGEEAAAANREEVQQAKGESDKAKRRKMDDAPGPGRDRRGVAKGRGR